MSSRDPLDDNPTDAALAESGGRLCADALSTGDRPAHPHWVLRGASGEMSLPEGEHLIGRGRHCHICILDSQLSREHARLRVLPHTVVITDCGSLNGVVVNGQRVQNAYELRAGDRVTIGQHEWHLEQHSLRPKTEPPPGAVDGVSRREPGAAATPPVAPNLQDIARTSSVDKQPRQRLVDDWTSDIGSGAWRCPPTTDPAGGRGTSPWAPTGESPAVRPLADSDEPAEPKPEPLLDSRVIARAKVVRETASTKAELPGFSAAAEMAHKALEFGNPSEAVRQLAPQLSHLLQRARAGVPVHGEQCAEAAQLAVRLTHATLEGRWLGQVFEIHTGSRRTLPTEVIDELFSLPRELQLPLDVLRTHLAWLEEHSPAGSDEHDLSRLQSFVRLVAIR